MEGFAIIRKDDTYSVAPLATFTKDLGKGKAAECHPDALPDGTPVWKWSDSQASAQKLADKMNAIRGGRK